MKRILSVLLGLLIALPVLAVVQQGQQKPRFANTWAAIRDVEPGEIVTISPRFGIHSDRSHCIRPGKTARCIFEYIEF